MDFSTPDKVADVIDNLKTAALLRDRNRALIEGLFNGEPPYTAAEVAENKIQTNINFKEGMLLLQQARDQLENGLLSTGNFFTITVPDAPIAKRQEYGGTLTLKANRIFKRSRPFLHTMRSKIGSIALHGIGPQMWQDQYNPFPFFVPIEDLMIPTDTELTFENLTYFAVRRKMTPGALVRKTFAVSEKNRDPGWNMKAVGALLKDYKDLNQNLSNWNWAENPEKIVELIKQNAVYWDSDAVPCIWFWDFYHQNDDGSQEWYRDIILDSDCVPGKSTQENKVEFVYHKKKRYSANLNELLHVQFGDGNNKPPFVYWSVRGIGWILYDVCQMMNRLRCQFTQRVFEDLMMLFRVSDPADRSRLDKIYMGLSRGIIPEGLQFVKREERPDANSEEVGLLMSNFKQLMGEGTAAYTQDIDNDTNKERTAFEVHALLSQTTKLTGTILNLAYLQEEFAYEEECRRLTIKGTPDFTSKKFQQECEQAGIPKKWIDASRWNVEAERVMGGGNAALAQAKAQALMGTRQFMNPSAQARVLNKYVFTVTGDPKEAEFLAPLDGAPQVTDSIHDTELVFASLMQGIPITPKPGTNPVEAAGTTIRMMDGVVGQIVNSGGMATPQQVTGLQLAEKYAMAYIQMLSSDKTAKPLIKKFTDALGKLMNEVKGFAQRLQEQAKAAAAKNGNGQMDPEAIANIHAKMAELEVKLKGKQASDSQKLQHNERKFQQSQKIKAVETVAGIQRDNLKAAAAAARPAKKSSVKE